MSNRRNFIRSSLFAVTGAGLAGNRYPKTPHVLITGKETRKFVYRTLGKTGIKIPVISMGTGNCNTPGLIKEAHKQGVKLFATHQAYNNGNNEKMVGEALSDMPRDSYMIMTGTNGGLSIDNRTGMFKKETNAEKYMKAVDASIQRLQVDSLDILNLGYGATRESVFYEPLLMAMETMKKQGRTKYLCLATHKLEPEAVRAAADTGIYDIVMPAYNFKKENREEIAEALQYAVDKGLGIISMKTMAGAYWDKEKSNPINGVAALKWVLKNENIHTTVPDCANYDQLYMDLDIMADMDLSEQDKNDLQRPEGLADSGLYCEQCGECLARCSEGLDIPTLMRSYMYAYGYSNLGLARKTFDGACIASDACMNCPECTVQCSVGFNVREKIADISRIRYIPEDMIS